MLQYVAIYLDNWNSSMLYTLVLVLRPLYLVVNFRVLHVTEQL